MKDVQKAIRFTMTLLISCILCVLAGVWLDEKLHSAPVFLLVLLAYAIGANFYLLWKAVSKDD
ncbi:MULTISPECIES: AtpZ/AtpI family protein [Bacillota]|jgi:ATP synthase protein I|uniref:AtpZ/AtpI family protein n=2 Tax=Amedibacillus TaxID=2749846 RepID=A0A7G9GPW1_9FIRM|nr:MULTISPECIES: AtpZ/AtpI family protein [Bacillota]QNM12843.1 AtpZ/AtpI family protein [[Eubacterium] hominis]MCH4286723.1 AtpZ/AtpI family protein [Amedibacillus hominis]RGB58195.1 AtpZ/AtpI family protein [Absiella sp. AM22-9]RGB59968.1 AtpZ/AtpI family protein [Absiella sp. AM10-20]RGB65995.1 AtpZ/AtpI family protein [Absiella sp. AM09-45]